MSSKSNKPGDSSKKNTVNDQPLTGAQQKESRRKVLKITLIGGAVISTSVVPDKWKKPVLDSVVLPSHAETTDDSGSSGGGATTTSSPGTTATTTTTTGRPTTTTPKPTTTMKPYPNGNATVTFSFSDWVDEQVS